MGTTRPPAVSGLDRLTAIDVHQLRAGHWSGSQQYLHRVGKSPTPQCAACNDQECSAALCPLCEEEADTPAHILLRCPALMGLRFRLTGSIHTPTSETLRSIYFYFILFYSKPLHRANKRGFSTERLERSHSLVGDKWEQSHKWHKVKNVRWETRQTRDRCWLQVLRLQASEVDVEREGGSIIGSVTRPRQLDSSIHPLLDSLRTE
jgi:hypothetical protein